MEIIDREREKEWLEQMDTILIFVCIVSLWRWAGLIGVQAALFAGFLSAFLIELLGRLEPDPMDIIQDVLIYQTQMMRNSSLGPYVPADFSPPEHIVVVNALFYASLGVMILAAFIAMLIKSWVREFDRGLRAISIPEQRAKAREFRYLGMERWKFSEMVGILPFLIQISLLLYAIGLVLFLFHISKPSFGVTTAIFGIGVLYYGITTSISVFVTSSPFHSPLSRALGKVYQRVHAYFCPSIEDFLSATMDTTPATALGRVRRNIQVILQKLRPYVEKDFVEPITAVTMDEVQLSTAASALQRIHDSAPNSQHSEALQSSVWQVAGGAAHRIPPLFNLPSWIIDRVDDEEYFSQLPPTIPAALVATSLRARDTRHMRKIARARAVLPCVQSSDDPWAHVVVEVSKLSHIKVWNPYQIVYLRTVRLNLLKVLMGTGFHREASLWLLRTLSELWCSTWLSGGGPFFIDICLPMLMTYATEWGHGGTPDIVLLEAVVTFAAISCSRDYSHELNILPSIRDHPWLLQNIRNTDIISTLYEGTHPEDHKRLTSMLFLIVYALIYRNSFALAIQYSTIITAERDLSLYASALTAIAPAMTDFGLYAISRILMAQQPQRLHVPCFEDERCGDLADMYSDYDERFGASENLDPNLSALLLMLSKQTPSRWVIRPWHIKLKNPWLRLMAGAVAQLEIPDGPGFPMGLFYHHGLHNMIAATFLLRYQRGIVPGCTLSLLASFMQSRELPVSSVALKSYMVARISHSNSPAPSCYLSAAVSSVFNVVLPEEQFIKGWEILGILVDGFDSFSIEWRRTFAEGFTLTRRPLPRPQGEMESRIAEDELEAIITWEYFHKEEIDSGLTDSHFSGLDWMAMAWSHHLSQQSGGKTAGSRQGDPQLQERIGSEVNEEFVFRVLCKLLDAASYHQIVSIIPELREFVQWFDDTKLTEYRITISALVERVIRRHEAFHKSYCSFRM